MREPVVLHSNSGRQRLELKPLAGVVHVVLHVEVPVFMQASMAGARSGRDYAFALDLGVFAHDIVARIAAFLNSVEAAIRDGGEIAAVRIAGYVSELELGPADGRTIVAPGQRTILVTAHRNGSILAQHEMTIEATVIDAFFEQLRALH